MAELPKPVCLKLDVNKNLNASDFYGQCGGAHP